MLDVHFCPRTDEKKGSLFGAADSRGGVGLFEVVGGDGLGDGNGGGEARIVSIGRVKCFSEDVLVTAFAWGLAKNARGRVGMGVTGSGGQVCLVEVQGLGNGEEEHGLEKKGREVVEVTRHELEAWTLAFTPDERGVLSGGDDCALRFSGVGGGDESVSWVDRKIHGAGVTAILPVWQDESGLWVITGSYDDRIRLVHAASTGRRRVLAEMDLGGGVWRVKVVTRSPAQEEGGALDVMPQELVLLVSCMHAGARIVKLSGKEDDWAFEVLARFEEHKSMNYGSDFHPETDENGHRILVSTSFYDQLLCAWKY